MDTAGEADNLQKLRQRRRFCIAQNELGSLMLHQNRLDKEICGCSSYTYSNTVPRRYMVNKITVRGDNRNGVPLISVALVYFRKGNESY